MKSLAGLLKEFIDHTRSLHHSENTLKGNRLNLGRFIRFLDETYGIKTIDKLQRRHLYAWVKHLNEYRTRQGLPLRPSSINKNIANTRQWLSYHANQGYVQQRLLDVLEYVKEPQLLPTSVLTHAQVKKLISQIKTDSPFGYRDRVMTEVLYSTGMRIAELLNLDITHVDIKNATAFITGKGNKQRVVPIGKTALRYLETYLIAIRPFLVRDRSEQALFLNKLGKRMTYERFLNAIRTYTRAADLGINVTPHTFRRSCATELIRGGANIYHVKELLGHKNLNTLRHYAKLTIIDLKKTHARCHPRERDSS